jgi:1-acyl-sn-glycerol-3-phosphate acyltransferase
MQPIRSFLFTLAYFGWTAIVLLTCWWLLFLSHRHVLALVHFYVRTIVFLEKHVLGLEWRVIGREHVPAHGSFIVAAKHQSAWETMKLHLLFPPDPAVVLKKELLRIPIWGSFARKLELIAIDRAAKGEARTAMLTGATEAIAAGRPIVIFPQGTRVPPGRPAKYRFGVANLYEQLQLPVLPMALNSGVFWPKSLFGKRGGCVTVEFLPLLAPGLSSQDLMATLEEQLETVSNRLVVEAGGPETPRLAPAPKLREKALS